ncbi:Putative dehydrogenase [hydrothermal vent metagenome]|uniref:Dehydrogenase n=1 Tax=hydrothermal vent metagenome TaxID=652676 RepID=A0A3B1DRW3_9ZZZZ
MPTPTSSTSTNPTRREFVKVSATTAAAAATAVATGAGIPLRAFAAGSDEIRIGVVGAGSRGKGACVDCLSHSEGVRLVAIGDLTIEIATTARSQLQQTEVAQQVQVPDEALFGGLDAYKKVINHPEVDLVILTTSPGFRPMHLAEAVRAGKHIFMEKPVCVDPVGYRSVIASGEIAKQKGLAIVAGTMFRRQESYIEAIALIHEGAIGTPLGGTSRYCSNGIWYRPRQPGMTDLEYQLANWYHFVWLSGDQVVEQAVHNIDAIVWAMGGPPRSAFGSGGQFTRPPDSEIHDSLSVDFSWGDGIDLSFKCRQIPGAKATVMNTIVGTKGIAHVNPGGSKVITHDGKVLLDITHKGPYPYALEHSHLIESIRSGNPLNEARQVAESSLAAVMARMAAYTGQQVDWDFVAHESSLQLMPDHVDETTTAPTPFVRIPGRHKLV